MLKHAVTIFTAEITANSAVQVKKSGVQNVSIAQPTLIRYFQCTRNRRCMMTYKVHKFNIKMEKDQQDLENFLNSLNTEVISIIPNVKPTMQPMGATAKVDFLYVVTKEEL